MVSYAPNVTARRILIAVLAFAMAAAFIFVSAVAPADGKGKDPKEYSVTVTPDSANLGVSTEYTVTFKNLSDNTVTQRAGAFSIDFGDQDFVVDSTLAEIEATLSNTSNRSWIVESISGDEVIISATSGGERIHIDESVTFKLLATGTSAGPKTLETAGDQEAGGDFNGGSKFDQPPKFGKPQITVVQVATPCLTNGSNECEVNDPDGEWKGDLSCIALCGFLINDEGGIVADITVLTNGNLILTLTTTVKGPAPGKASVTVDGKTLPDCGTSENSENCVHINKVKGTPFTQYTVFWNGDPNFRFR